MIASYIVHSAAAGSTTMPVALPDGSTVEATVPAFTVQLVDPTEKHGTVTLRFVGSEVQAATDLFQPGRAITGSFAGN